VPLVPKQGDVKEGGLKRMARIIFACQKILQLAHVCCYHSVSGLRPADDGTESVCAISDTDGSPQPSEGAAFHHTDAFK
jgi:hypothetical protein